MKFSVILEILNLLSVILAMIVSTPSWIIISLLIISWWRYVLLLAGLFSNHGPLYFVNTKVSFSKMGLTCHIAKIHSEVYIIAV